MPEVTMNEAMMIDQSDDEEINEEQKMMILMGFGDFGSTKGKHVFGNDVGDINMKKTRTYRQYMNRRGGFNRPLDKTT
ncbi:U4/U6.U5 small nuclear ribonucleoprotein [Nowakowskiella sp. JEL0078]|nr:U4/U6.U5 small nuclear ribonucleoprotein [Nowakowskiella sp. JEL0078]